MLQRRRQASFPFIKLPLLLLHPQCRSHPPDTPQRSLARSASSPAVHRAHWLLSSMHGTLRAKPQHIFFCGQRNVGLCSLLRWASATTLWVALSVRNADPGAGFRATAPRKVPGLILRLPGHINRSLSHGSSLEFHHTVSARLRAEGRTRTNLGRPTYTV